MVFLTLTILVQVGCLLVGAYRLFTRFADTRWCCRPYTARDAAAQLNLMASMSRLVWLSDPVGGGSFSLRAADGILLRLPQALWIAAYLCVVLVWSDIMASARGRTASSWYSFGVAIAVTVLVICTFTITVLDAAGADGFGGHEAYRVAGDAVFTAYVLALSIGGFLAGRRLLVLGEVVESSLASITEPTERWQAELVVTRIRLAFRATVVAVAAACVLVISVVLVSVTGVSPTTNPAVYMLYMYIIHLGVEPIAAVTLLVSTKQDRVRSPSSSASTLTASRHLSSSAGVALLATATPEKSSSGVVSESTALLGGRSPVRV